MARWWEPVRVPSALQPAIGPWWRQFSQVIMWWFRLLRIGFWRWFVFGLKGAGYFFGSVWSGFGRDVCCGVSGIGWQMMVLYSRLVFEWGFDTGVGGGRRNDLWSLTFNSGNIVGLSQTFLISGGSFVSFWCWDKMLRFFKVFREGGCLPSLLLFFFFFFFFF